MLGTARLLGGLGGVILLVGLAWVLFSVWASTLMETATIVDFTPRASELTDEINAREHARAVGYRGTVAPAIWLGWSAILFALLGLIQAVKGGRRPSRSILLQAGAGAAVIACLLIQHYVLASIPATLSCCEWLRPASDTGITIGL